MLDASDWKEIILFVEFQTTKRTLGPIMNHLVPRWFYCFSYFNRIAFGEDVVVLNKFKIVWETFKGLGPLTPMILFSLVGPALGALALISTSQLWFPQLLELTQWPQLGLYFALTIGLVGLSFVPTHASSLIAGMLFGVVQGPVFALLAVVGASYFSLGIIRLVLKERTYQLLLSRPAAAQIHEELLMKSGWKAVVFISLIRLSPLMPFAATNVLLAAARAQTQHFLLGSLLGLAPRIILVAVAGAGLSELDFSQSSNVWIAVLGTLSTLLLIVYVGKIIRRVVRPT